MSEINPNRRQLTELLSKSHNTVFFGGAGVSTESGIPDFRSEAGLYAAKSVFGHAPEELLSHSFFINQPEIFFRYYKENLICRDAAPNAAHRALAALERAGKLQAVVTQNIDDLHQRAGSRNVFELHGSNARQYCRACGKKYSLDYIFSPESGDTVVPKCAKCGGVVRPDVVLYEEGLDDAVVQGAVSAISRAELLIVGGTSLAVYPAAGLLRYFQGGALVLINKSETPYDGSAQLILREAIGEALGAVAEAMGL
ncbi:MAG: NAD-dependent protein deacylase [Oscillospiraceae bacterium]|jgi:NAD-dependent deacetylase|nr:NAD-dependent protein deacylase [Oscillospiraceae bacterium]